MASPRILVAAVVAGVVFLVGFGLGRMGSPGDVDAVAQHPSPERRVVDGAEKEPARADSRTVRGFPRTEEGAVAAAVRYATVLDGPTLLDEEERVAAIRQVAAEGAEADLETALGRVADIIIEGLGLTPALISDPGFVWRPVPVGWQLRRYSEDESLVALWGTGVLVAEGRQIQQPGWRTVEVTLRWEREGWRLVAMRSDDGPTPPLPGTDEVASVGRQIAEFGVFDHVPASEER